MPRTRLALVLAPFAAGAALAQTAEEATLSAVPGGESVEAAEYVVGPDGRPVYAFLTEAVIGGDGFDALRSCNEVCREDWGLVTADQSPSAGAGLQADLVGTVQEDDTRIVTYNDYILFQFHRDTAGDPPEGQSIFSYGGYWTLLDAEGEPIKSAPVIERVDPPQDDADPDAAD